MKNRKVVAFALIVTGAIVGASGIYFLEGDILLRIASAVLGSVIGLRGVLYIEQKLN